MITAAAIVRRLRRLGGAAPSSQRRTLAMSYLTPKVDAVDRWLVESRETTNFTYNLTDLNLDHLAGFVAAVTGCTVARSRQVIRELLDDRQLSDHIRACVNSDHPRAALADPEARYGRRVGWYAIARIKGPRLIVETGVEKGMGSVVLCAALLRNAAEGRPGRYIGTDIDPAAGWLMAPPYTSVGQIMYGDSIESLKKIAGPIDLFINDSDHSSDYERREYLEIAPRLGEDAIVIGDNAHVTPELFKFSQSTGRRFLYFQELPRDHWYPGAGIGAAFGREGDPVR